jgi:hypothetical protein
MRLAATAALVLAATLTAACDNGTVVLAPGPNAESSSPTLLWQVRDETGVPQTVKGNTIMKVSSGDSFAVTLWGQDPRGVEEVSLDETFLNTTCHGSVLYGTTSTPGNRQDKTFNSGNIVTEFPLFQNVDMDFFCPPGKTLSPGYTIILNGYVRNHSGGTTKEYLSFGVTVS